MDRKAPSIGTLPPWSDDGDARPARADPVLEPRPEAVPRRRRHLKRKLLIAFVAALLCATIVPVLLLRVVPAFTSAFMLRYQVERVFTRGSQPPLRHDWVSWDEIAPSAKLAVIAAEDQRFADHLGIDFQAVSKAIEHNRRGGSTRGASTITQQTAKNLFLWPQRSWLRKALETGYTVLIELAWPKQRVLEVYLNIAEFGPGVYGVEAASQAYFRKSADKLTWHEAALLAAVLPNPKRYRVVEPSLYVQNRAAWIRGQMGQLGMQSLDGL